MSQPLFDNLAEIGSRISTASHVFLFPDFDGMLTPIVERPEMAPLQHLLGVIAVCRIGKMSRLSA